MEDTYDILIADHDEAITVCMTEALMGEGYRVLPCLPGALTVDLIAVLRPALLITELRRGDCEPTIQLIAAIQKHAATRSCAILVTSTDQRLLEAQCHHLGHATLSKPYQLDTLLDCVHQALDQTPTRVVVQ